MNITKNINNKNICANNHSLFPNLQITNDVWCIQVTGILVPVTIGNVVQNRNILEEDAESGPGGLCMLFGYLVTVTCTVSIWNLAMIALNRWVLHVLLGWPLIFIIMSGNTWSRGEGWIQGSRGPYAVLIGAFILSQYCWFIMLSRGRLYSIWTGRLLRGK